MAEDDASESTGADSDEDTDENINVPGGAASPLIFLLGAALFVGSLVAFGADLLTGHDITRSIAANGVSALVLVWWAGADTLSDPDSTVDSRSGAAGTGLLLLGLYLLAGAVVVGVTSVVHDRFGLVPWLAGLGVALVVVGVVVFPRGTLVEAQTDDEEERDDDASTDPEETAE